MTPTVLFAFRFFLALWLLLGAVWGWDRYAVPRGLPTVSDWLRGHALTAGFVGLGLGLLCGIALMHLYHQPR